MLAALLATSLALAGDVDVRFGVGLIDVGQLYVGGTLSPAFELHGTVGTNLGLLTYFGAGVGAIWRPWRWGETGAHHFSIGVGPDLWAGPAPSVVPVVAAATVDLRYAWRRPGAPLGLALASRWGLGVTTDLGATGPDAGRIEPALLLQLLQAGVTF